MTQQDFKALLDSLNRIASAIEGKSGKSAAETVNRFSIIFKRLQYITGKQWPLGEHQNLLDYIADTQNLYVKIANEVMSEDQNERN